MNFFKRLVRARTEPTCKKWKEQKKKKLKRKAIGPYRPDIFTDL